MSPAEAKSGAKALYLQAASLAGFEVSPFSPEKIAELVGEAFPKVDEKRRPEAVANLLTIVGESLLHAVNREDTELHEEDVDGAKKKVCPVFPFD